MEGLIHIYTGDGKGKTTAAIGAGIRACGRGRKVLMVQFLKGIDTGEILALKKLEPSFVLKRSDKKIKFVWEMDEKEKAAAASYQNELLEYVCHEIAGNNFDFIILDEIMAAVNLGFIKEVEIEKLLDGKPEQTEIILTGRDAPLSFIKRAAYVSEIKKVKHPMDEGVKARRSIEY